MSEGLDRRSMLLAAGGTVLAGGALGVGPQALAQATPDAEAARKRNFAGARLSSKYRFDDADMDLFFLIALGWGAAGGLSMGEAFNVASTIKDGDADSWVAAFRASGDRQTKLAADWTAQGWRRQSAQAQLKAFASYRSGWQFAPVGPVFDDLYARAKSAFRTALPDLGFPAVFFGAPYKGKTLPGVFLQSANPNAPVALLLGGADTGFEEIFFTAGRAVFEAGYSVAMADLPGQGITMKDGLYWEAEPEKPISAIVDVLVQRFAAKPGRLALFGYSLGGYWATRAAGHEKRFATVMASTPIPRAGELFASATSGQRKMAAEGVQVSSATLRNQAVFFWKAGVKNSDELVEHTRNFIADPAIVTMPFLSIVGAGEGATFQSQSDAWNAQIRSTNKKLVRLDAATGGDAHCQAGNRLRLAQELTGWMGTIFQS